MRVRVLLAALLGAGSLLAACGTARRPAVPEPPPSVPCAENLLGVSSETLAGRTPEQLRTALVASRVIEPDTSVRVIVYDKPLVVRNLRAVRQILQRHALRSLAAGEQRTSVVVALASAEGRIVEAQVERGSGRPEADLAAVAAFREFVFHPPLHGACSIRVLVRMPVTLNGPAGPPLDAGARLPPP